MKISMNIGRRRGIQFREEKLNLPEKKVVFSLLG